MCLQSENICEIFKSTPVPVFMTDSEFSVIWANSCALKQYPQLSSENGLFQLFSSKQMAEFKADKVGFSVPLGAMPNFAATFSPLSDGYLVMIGYSSAENSPAMLPQSINFMNGLISGQLRVPVSNLFGIVSSIARTADNIGDVHLEELAKSANSECYHLLRFAVDMSAYMKYIGGIGIEKHSVIDLGVMLHELCEAVKMIIPVRINVSICDRAVLVKADERSLSHAFLHIISNSCRYNREKNEISLSLSVKGEMTVITVKDRGRGIPAEIIPKICEPFFSYDPDNMPFSGGGLGLAIARDIISRHGGTIAVTSVEGEGTTVAISLPLCRETKLDFKETASARDMIFDHKSLPYIILSDCCECPEP